MNNQWKTFLESLSANVPKDGPVSFPDAAADPQCALHELSGYGLIKCSGEDTRDFLQGQVTNDVRDLTATRSLLGGHCNAKGRMLATFRLFLRAEDIYLQLPRGLLEEELRRLRMYLLRSRVTLEDVSDDLVAIGVSGACAPALIARHLGHSPDNADATAQQGEITIIRHSGTPSRFELIGPPGEMASLWRTFSDQAAPASAGYWRLLDIRAGIPTVYQETREIFIPQMTNLQLISGVSFTKGCYTGQEVVARMQYLGKLKRRMYLVEIETEHPPRPGDELFSASSASGQGAGRIVDVEAAAAGRYEALAVVEIAGAEAGDVTLGEAGPPLRFKTLPYSFAG